MSFSARLVCASILLASSAGLPLPGAAQLPPEREPLDTLVRVSGHELHFMVYRGDVPVTVLFEAGGGADLTSWADVPERVAWEESGTTVVAYDRAGLGGSSLGPPDLSPTEEVDHLRLGLNRLGAPRATILVAHSYGAMLALLSAARFPDRVLGLVLVDPMNPRFVRAVGDFLNSTVPEITDPATDRERAIVRMLESFSALSDRVERLEPGLDQPMVIITAGEPWWDRDDVDRSWRRSHEAMAAAGDRRELVIAEGSDHDVPEERPDVIIAAVRQILAGASRR